MSLFFLFQGGQAGPPPAPPPYTSAGADASPFSAMAADAAGTGSLTVTGAPAGTASGADAPGADSLTVTVNPGFTAAGDDE